MKTIKFYNLLVNNISYKLIIWTLVVSCLFTLMIPRVMYWSYWHIPRFNETDYIITPRNELYADIAINTRVLIQAASIFIVDVTVKIILIASLFIKLKYDQKE